MKNNADKKIFISYRVQDTSGETGRLVDALKQYFTDDQLFMDIENLEPGMDFTEGIEKSLSACDVFLAVIGPHWVGQRPAGPARINDEDDWVRTEVGTALRSNIRLLPVLVDGGEIPKDEQLPADLQPLLKRQTVEISNKRWRYDTEQLVRFLVNTVGIPPKRASLQRAAAAPKKNKTWLYVGAGFGLAIAVLILIASLLPQDQNAGTTNPQTGASNLSQNSASGKTNEPTSTSTNGGENSTNISGIWDEIDEEDASTFVMTQNGSQVGVQIQMGGQLLGAGNGYIQGRQIELNVPVMGVTTTMNATLSDDGNTITGTYHVPATGASEAVKLVRRGY